ncbi:MAG: hypothetical protein ACRENE_07870 [Polyangiaceae bacterium]
MGLAGARRLSPPAGLLGPCTLLVVLGGCGSRTGIERPEEVASAARVVFCPLPALPCVADGFGCDAPSLVDAVCDEAQHTWQCPGNARHYARAPDSGSVCLPFAHAAGISSIQGWGLSSLPGVPTDDGRCLWIAENVTLADGTQARNVALVVDRRAPFGTCPTDVVSAPFAAVTMEGGDDPSILVQIDGGYRLAGATHVLYRLFKIDPKAVYGVDEMGGGVARWDSTIGRIVVPSPSTPFRWGTDLDLGDAMLPAGDGTHAYVWGCTGGKNGTFVNDCRLARLDASDDVELYGAAGTFIASVRASDGPVVFVAGSWMSSVVAVPSGYRHVYIGDFGNHLSSQEAATPLGPWSDAPDLGTCDLPSDGDAFCAGPVVHDELADPTRPGELPVTYGVGESSPSPMGDPRQYRPRMVWVH